MPYKQGWETLVKKYTIATTFLLVWTTTQDKVAV